MTLNPKRSPVPTELVTSTFILRRQHLADNTLDFEAVMDSKDVLRSWSDSTWPEDDFTLDANAEDLAMHIGEHERDEAYGFSVFTPSHDRLLGSLYIDAVAPFREHYLVDAEQERALAGFDVRVEYWLRRGTEQDFETAFLRDVRRWLTQAWWFDRVTFGSRRDAVERRKVYEAAGLTEVARLESKDGRRRFHFHG